MRIVALDLSLTETGYAVQSGGFPRSGVLKPPKGAVGVERLGWIRREVMILVECAELVLVEGYAFAQANRAHQMGELGGVIRLALHDADLRYLEVGPMVLKKFATGKGSAKKEDMLAAAIRRLGYEDSNHNEADALWLLHAGLQLVERPMYEFPKAHVEALKGLRLPEQRKEAA